VQAHLVDENHGWWWDADSALKCRKSIDRRTDSTAAEELSPDPAAAVAGAGLKSSEDSAVRLRLASCTPASRAGETEAAA
jgi:hypothetical protein